MAIVFDHFEFEVTVADTGGNQTTRSWPMVAADYVEATEDAEDALAAFTAITEGAIVGYAIREVLVNDALTLPSDAEIENQALLEMTLHLLPLSNATMSIPAPTNGIFMGTSGKPYNIVDPSDVALNAWITLFKDGGILTLPQDRIVGALVGGKRIHRKSNRG